MKKDNHDYDKVIVLSDKLKDDYKEHPEFFENNKIKPWEDIRYKSASTIASALLSICIPALWPDKKVDFDYLRASHYQVSFSRIPSKEEIMQYVENIVFGANCCIKHICEDPWDLHEIIPSSETINYKLFVGQKKVINNLSTCSLFYKKFDSRNEAFGFRRLLRNYFFISPEVFHESIAIINPKDFKSSVEKYIDDKAVYIIAKPSMLSKFLLYFHSELFLSENIGHLRYASSMLSWMTGKERALPNISNFDNHGYVGNHHSEQLQNLNPLPQLPTEVIQIISSFVIEKELDEDEKSVVNNYFTPF